MWTCSTLRAESLQSFLDKSGKRNTTYMYLGKIEETLLAGHSLLSEFRHCHGIVFLVKTIIIAPLQTQTLVVQRVDNTIHCRLAGLNHTTVDTYNFEQKLSNCPLDSYKSCRQQQLYPFFESPRADSHESLFSGLVLARQVHFVSLAIQWIVI